MPSKFEDLTKKPQKLGVYRQISYGNLVTQQ